MNNIGHFTILYKKGGAWRELHFLRIANYLAWHTKNPVGEGDIGDWITLVDQPVTEDVVKEGCEVLADQAASTLEKLNVDSFSVLSTFFRLKIKKIYWK